MSDDEWRFIKRKDDYPPDYPIDLADPSGRDLLARTLKRFEISLKRPKAALESLEAVNPTILAEQAWQDIWLACGEQPETCLATFIEFLISKFLSDLNVLHSDSKAVPVDFETVISKPTSVVLEVLLRLRAALDQRIFSARH